MSHPVWVRGLKHALARDRRHEGDVAPRVGAWIETFYSRCSHNPCYVAPRVGAWIETHQSRHLRFCRSVAPRVGAWIETQFASHLQLIWRVAPRVGAWIETLRRIALPPNLLSHPVWVRGLKLGVVCGGHIFRRRTPCGCVD